MPDNSRLSPKLKIIFTGIGGKKYFEVCFDLVIIFYIYVIQVSKNKGMD